MSQASFNYKNKFTPNKYKTNDPANQQSSKTASASPRTNSTPNTFNSSSTSASLTSINIKPYTQSTSTSNKYYYTDITDTNTHSAYTDSEETPFSASTTFLEDDDDDDYDETLDSTPEYSKDIESMSLINYSPLNEFLSTIKKSYIKNCIHNFIHLSIKKDPNINTKLLIKEIQFVFNI